MKKLIFGAFMLFSISTYAQSTSVPAIDTITDAETVTIAQPNASYFKASDGIFSVGVVITKISGTTAGRAVIEASIDNTNYKGLYGTAADTFTVANTSGAQVKNWFISGVKPAKIRVRFIGSGTQSTQIKGFFIKN